MREHDSDKAPNEATEQEDHGRDEGAFRQLKRVATTAAVATLTPVIKEAVTKAAGQAATKAPELLVKAGGPQALAEKAKEKLPSFGGGDKDGGGDAPSGTGKGRRMPVQQSVDVAVPLDLAYNQFTQFEDFPKFMHRVQSVEQRDDARVIFRSKQWGVNRQWEAQITDQRPDERIAWRSRSGVKLTGVATFHRLSDRLTRIEVNVDFEPDGPLEKIGRAMRFAKRAIRADLHRFKAFVELREQETGAWRGYIDEGEVVDEATYYGEDEERGEERTEEREPRDEAGEDERDERDEHEDEPEAEDHEAEAEAEADEDDEPEAEADEDDEPKADADERGDREHAGRRRFKDRKSRDREPVSGGSRGER